MKKLIIVGQGRHGKDTFCEIAEKNFNIKYTSSSWFACCKFVYKKLQDMGFNYGGIDECYADRHNFRNLWYDLISEYNRENQSRLATEIFEDHDIYNGMRSLNELQGSEHLADYIIYIDATERVGATETPSSNNIRPHHADAIIYNNGTLEEFEKKVNKFFNLYLQVSE